jgi:TolB protein
LTRNRANDESPVWSPDGKRIAFVSDRDGGNRQLYVMDTDDYQAEPLTTSDNVTDAALPEWSPDGKYIAFVQSTDQGGTDISILNIETGEMENITQNPGQVDTAPAWSPDGKRMLFQSERSGNNDIFVMNIGEGFSGLDNLTEHPANDTLPCWSPDGEYIVFQSNRDGNNSLYVMRADGTQQTSLTGNNTGASEDAADWHE